MGKVLTALFLCLTILCGIVETASGAAVGFGQKPASGSPESNPDIYTYELGSLGQEPCWFDEVIHYDPATGVLYYVRQNPWSSFDPLGLKTFRTRDSEVGPDERYEHTPTMPEKLKTLGLDPDEDVEISYHQIHGESIAVYQQGDQVRYGWNRSTGEGHEIGTLWADNFDEFVGHIQYGIPWTGNSKSGNLQKLAEIIPIAGGADAMNGVRRGMANSASRTRARSTHIVNTVVKKKASRLLEHPGRISSEDIVKHLSGKSFEEKVVIMRKLLHEAKIDNKTFDHFEALGKNFEVVFVGTGRKADGSAVSNVVAISRNGTVTKMNVDGIKMTSEFGARPIRLDLNPSKGGGRTLIDGKAN